MSEFTKGEWKSFSRSGYHNIVCEGLQVAMVSGKQHLANARLIAAAPDLLEACEGLMKDADNGSARFDDPQPGSIYLKAKAAIAKAIIT